MALLVQNLERLDESVKEEADGVHNTLGKRLLRSLSLLCVLYKGGWVIPPLSFLLTCFALELPALRWRTCGEFLPSTIVNCSKV